MLVLSRKRGEQIEIGDLIRVTVTDINSERVRVGIEAPRNIVILRKELARKPVSLTTVQTRPPRILVVDDSPEDRECYRRFINAGRECPYVIEETESGEQGLERCRAEAPDCLLLDYLLPDVNGLEFLHKLAIPTGHVPFPVVMLTGQGDEHVAVQAMKYGAHDYLVKRNLTGSNLRTALREAMDKTYRLSEHDMAHYSQLAG